MTATRTAMATKILRRVPFHRKAFNLGCRENPGFLLEFMALFRDLQILSDGNVQ